MTRNEFWNEIYKNNDQLNSLYSSYWNQYTGIGAWQFWVVLASLVVPVALLYFLVDRRRIFELFFFGYTVHVLWSYTDIALGRSGYAVHKYFLLPILPNAMNITASVLPVGFLLLYQYCTNRNKNFYLYSVLLSVAFAFVFAQLEEFIGLLTLRKGMTHFYLVLIDIGIAYIAYWFTKLIIRLKAKAAS
ncbi:hypothetical protein [Niallia nealsonii]|uniref:Uncharacterized protein n=1 Tax=Niallia nealsonii TaxID=115979 RepID=A0A2N0Z2K8_9BACI|nr:hypothetical protein [Niallia nealsonii]PKG23734.1 hypothetical protein CWS01_10360 [Niallia nealsonii]